MFFTPSVILANKKVYHVRRTKGYYVLLTIRAKGECEQILTTEQAESLFGNYRYLQIGNPRKHFQISCRWGRVRRDILNALRRQKNFYEHELAEAETPQRLITVSAYLQALEFVNVKLSTGELKP